MPDDDYRKYKRYISERKDRIRRNKESETDDDYRLELKGWKWLTFPPVWGVLIIIIATIISGDCSQPIN